MREARNALVPLRTRQGDETSGRRSQVGVRAGGSLHRGERLVGAPRRLVRDDRKPAVDRFGTAGSQRGQAVEFPSAGPCPGRTTGGRSGGQRLTHLFSPAPAIPAALREPSWVASLVVGALPSSRSQAGFWSGPVSRRGVAESWVQPRAGGTRAPVEPEVASDSRALPSPVTAGRGGVRPSNTAAPDSATHGPTWLACLGSGPSTEDGWGRSVACRPVAFGAHATAATTGSWSAAVLAGHDPTRRAPPGTGLGSGRTRGRPLKPGRLLARAPPLQPLPAGRLTVPHDPHVGGEMVQEVVHPQAAQETRSAIQLPQCLQEPHQTPRRPAAAGRREPTRSDFEHVKYTKTRG